MNLLVHKEWFIRQTGLDYWDKAIIVGLGGKIMALIEKEKLRQEILDKYKKAKDSIFLLEKSAYYGSVSNRIPNYNADKMSFATYNKDNFVALFADMRESTKRAEELGPEKTFLTVHAIMPALIYVVEAYGGYVIDLPGDGIMALFKENRKQIYWNDNKKYLTSEELAFSAGEEILTFMVPIINEILESDKIPPLKFGVGIDSGECVITKAGTNTTFDTKAIGKCINNASKMSNGMNELWVSQNISNNIREHLFRKLTKGIEKDGWYYKSY